MLFSAFALNEYIRYFSRALFYYIIIFYIISFVIKHVIISRCIKLGINDVVLSLIFFYFTIITLIFDSYDSVLYMSLYFALIIVIRVELLNSVSKRMKESSFVLAINLAFITAGLVALTKRNFALSAGYGSIFRFIGSFGDPNFFALFGLIGIAYFLENDSSLSRFSMYLLASITLVFVLITYSKTGLIILLAIFTVRVLRNKKRKLSILIAFSILSLLLFGFLVLMYIGAIKITIISNYLDRFLTEYSGYNLIDSLSTGRWDIQSKLFSAFLDTPILNRLFGSGYDSSRKLIYEYSGRLISSHSVYLQMLVDFGWFGLLFYSFILVSLLLKYRYAGLVFLIASFSLSWPFTLPFFALFVLSPVELTRRRFSICRNHNPYDIVSS